MIEWETQAYALLRGETGSTFTTTSAPFRTCDGQGGAPDMELDTAPADTVERLCECAFEGPEEREPFTNSALNSRRMGVWKFIVRIGYQYTASGLEFDATLAQSGAGSKRAIRQRARADENVLMGVFTWHQNWATFTPPAVHIKQQFPPSIEWRADRAIVTLNYEFISNLNVPGSYGPTLTGS